jgi:hypothetical protein
MQFKNIFVLDVIYGYVQLFQAKGVTVVYVAGIRHTCDVSVQSTAPGRGQCEETREARERVK